MISKSAMRAQAGVGSSVSVAPIAVRSQISSQQGRLSSIHVQAISQGASAAKLPVFSSKIKAHNGSSVNLAKVGKPVVLFFYPKAGTPGCTKETETFAAKYNEFTKAGAKVFGISSDSTAEQKAFAKSTGAKFLLLTDEDDKLRKELGVQGDFLGLLKGRQTFVFDKKGNCVLSYNSQLNIGAHIDKALEALGGLEKSWF